MSLRTATYVLCRNSRRLHFPPAAAAKRNVTRTQCNGFHARLPAFRFGHHFHCIVVLCRRTKPPTPSWVEKVHILLTPCSSPTKGDTPILCDSNHVEGIPGVGEESTRNQGREQGPLVPPALRPVERLHGLVGGTSSRLSSLPGPQGAQGGASTPVNCSQHDARNRCFVYRPKTKRWQVNPLTPPDRIFCASRPSDVALMLAHSPAAGSRPVGDGVG